MKIIAVGILCFFLSIFQSNAQNTPTEAGELAEVYSQYFSLNREAIFLQLHKTSLAPGEALWFSAYAYSPQYYSPNQTTNLHVNLYSEEGKLLASKTIYMEEGHGEGHFELDPESFSPGEYVITAGTLYQQNFREDSKFVQQFSILGEGSSESGAKEYDLQLLPEGGHLVESVDNTLGVKLLDNSGKGVKFSEGRILDSRQQLVNSFRSNKFGISKFRLKPLPEETYTVILSLENGESISQKVMPAESRGIALSTSFLRGQVLFNFQTNAATFESLKDRSFLFAFHKDGEMKALNFVFSEDYSANVTLSEEALYKGMNTITIFNDQMQPVLERLVFNRDELARKNIAASFKRNEVDSLVVNFRASDSLGEHALSVSILPSETLSYEPKNNIFSAFYLEPYIQGDLEDGSYYFSDNTDLRRRDYDLDLLLLTQGWSKYRWQHIFGPAPREHYKHEQGFSISGRVPKRNPKTQKQLYISAPAQGLSLVADIQDDNSFRAENLFLTDSARVAFSILNDRNNKLTDSKIVAQVSPLKQSGDLSPALLGNLNFGREFSEENASEVLPDDFILGAEVLGTVFIDGKNLSEEEKFLEQERELNRGDMYGKFDLLSEEEARSFPDLFPLLRTKGFESSGNAMYSTRELMRKPPGVTFGLPAQPAVVRIDGMEVTVNDLRMLRTSEVKYIYTNKRPIGKRAYSGGEGGLIDIVTKDPYSRSSGNAPEVLLLNGFAETKEFYAPKYSSYTNTFFRNYGSIDWHPKLTLRNGSLDLRILNTGQPVRLFIEGMTAEGALISEEILVD